MNDLWAELQKTDLPIILYGMGDGADKILAVLSRYGITVDDFFASDGFVRGQTFHGKQVLRYAQVCEKYDDFIVLLAFASALPQVMDNIYRIAAEHTLYVPDVPVVESALFCADFYREHKEEFDLARALFADERSREVFDQIICCKLTGALEPLKASECDPDEPWQSILHPQDYRFTCDLGAYTGDTAKELLSIAPQIRRIYALEPDRRNFAKLSVYAQSEPRVCALRIGAGECESTQSVRNDGGRGAGKGSGEAVRFAALDRLVDQKIDYIKFDVEGSEREALLGAREIISRDRPEMLVSLYHRSEDLYALPLLIHELRSDYRMYLRRFPYIPAWDLNLYCV